ncbi:UNVERIFIED_CONTAM: Chitin synthase, class 3, partial [Siphonaria sp. JEL0065]
MVGRTSTPHVTTQTPNKYFPATTTTTTTTSTMHEQDRVFVPGSALTQSDLSILKSPTAWSHAFPSSFSECPLLSTPATETPSRINHGITTSHRDGSQEITSNPPSLFFFDSNGDPVNEATTTTTTYTNKHLKRRSCDILVDDDAFLNALCIESNPEPPFAPPPSPVSFGSAAVKASRSSKKKYCIGKVEHDSIAAAVEAIMKDQSGSFLGVLGVDLQATKLGDKRDDSRGAANTVILEQDKKRDGGEKTMEQQSPKGKGRQQPQPQSLVEMQALQSERILNPSHPNLPQPTLPNVDGFLRASTSTSTFASTSAFTHRINASSGSSVFPLNNSHSHHTTNHHLAHNHLAMQPRLINPGRTLTRPDRRHSEQGQADRRHIPFFGSLSLGRAKKKTMDKSPIKRNPWVWASWILTCCFPSFFIANVLGKRDLMVQQAWREKVALNIIIFLMMGAVGFLTFGFQNMVCPAASSSTIHLRYTDIQPDSNQIALHGALYAIAANAPHAPFSNVNVDQLVKGSKGADVGLLFPPRQGTGACAGLDNLQYPLFPCRVNLVQSGVAIWPNSSIVFPVSNTTTQGCHIGMDPSKFKYLQLKGDLVYDYMDVFNSINAKDGRKRLMIYSGHVLDVSLFYADNSSANALGAQVKEIVMSHIGKDASHAFATAGLRNEGQCLVDYLKIASVDSILPACFASTVIVWVSLMIILVVVLAKFVLALYFTYVIGWRLGNNRAYQRAMEDLRRRKDEYSKPHPKAAGLSASSRPEIIGGSSSNTGATAGMDDTGSLRRYNDPRAPMTSESRRSAAHRRESNRDLVDASRSWNANFGFMDIEAPPLDSETTKLLNDPTLMHCIAM